MICKCRFDKKKDIQETVPDLAISIAMALQTGVIKDTSDSTPYSKITSIEEVGSYLHDSIDIAMAAKRLGAVMSSSNPTSTDINDTVSISE